MEKKRAHKYTTKIRGLHPFWHQDQSHGRQFFHRLWVGDRAWVVVGSNGGQDEVLCSPAAHPLLGSAVPSIDGYNNAIILISISPLKLQKYAL